MGVKIGYRETDVGVIPKDWNVRRLGELATFRTGPFGSALHQSDYVEDEIPVVNPMQIIDGRIVPTSSMTIQESVARKLADFRLAKGTIVLGRRGEMGRCAVVQPYQEGWLCGTGSMIVRTSASLDVRFAQRILSSPPIIRAIENASVGSTMINLNQRTLENLAITLPPTVAEQESIAEALDDADALIESLEQLLSKKRHIKNGAMQELLSGRKRLPGFENEWRVRSLGELGKTFGGLASKRKEDFGIGCAHYVTFINVITNVVIDPARFERVNVNQDEVQNRVTKGDLFFNGSSETPDELGMCAFLGEDVSETFLNSFCFGFRLNEFASADGLFLAYLFRSHVGRDLLRPLAQGAIRYNLSKAALLNIELALPSVEEQMAVVAVLADMDAELQALEAKLTKARQIKQGMMQELLTGRIRLV